MEAEVGKWEDVNCFHYWSESYKYRIVREIYEY